MPHGERGASPRDAAPATPFAAPCALTGKVYRFAATVVRGLHQQSQETCGKDRDRHPPRVRGMALASTAASYRVGVTVGRGAKAPVLLAHVFVVIGNAGRETLAHTRATHSDSSPALVRRVARGEDMRRMSGNLSGLICGFAHGERPGTKTGTTAVPGQPVPPSLTRGACDGGVVAEKPASRASGWSQRFVVLQAGSRGTLPRIPVRRG